MKQTLILFLITPLAIGAVSSTEFRVNTGTAYDQKYPDIAMGKEGRFVVVWRSYRQDGSSGGIFGQRFESACGAVGGEFQINSTVGGDQTEPSIGMNGAGEFVVVWRSKDGDSYEICARRFDSKAQAVGGELCVSGCPAESEG